MGERGKQTVCHMLTYRLQESKTYENAAAIAAAGGAAGAGAGAGAGAAGAGAAGGTGAASTAAAAQPQRPAHAKEYNFLDMELKYGFLQVSLEYTNPCVFISLSSSFPPPQLTEALSYLHYSGHVIHRNVCPSSILITKRGIWKLAGMEYVGE